MIAPGALEFHEYVAARGPALLRAALLLTGDRCDAEDLLQAALTKTFLAWERINDQGALDGYVRRAMVNTQISWWRRRRLEVYPTDVLPDQPVDDCTQRSEQHDVLDRALARLPERQRAAVMLRYYEDLSEAEIAGRLGVSIGTVKSTVSRAMAKLRADAQLGGNYPLNRWLPRGIHSDDAPTIVGLPLTRRPLMRLRALALAALLLCPACGSGSDSGSVDKKTSCAEIKTAIENISKTDTNNPQSYVQNYGTAAKQLRAVADKSADKNVKVTAKNIADALDGYLKLVPATGTANTQDSMVATSKIADATSALNTSCGALFQ